MQVFGALKNYRMNINLFSSILRRVSKNSRRIQQFENGIARSQPGRANFWNLGSTAGTQYALPLDPFSTTTYMLRCADCEDRESFTSYSSGLEHETVFTLLWSLRRISVRLCEELEWNLMCVMSSIFSTTTSYFRYPSFEYG